MNSFLPAASSVSPIKGNAKGKRVKAASSSSGGSTSSFNGYESSSSMMSPEKTLVEFISTSAAFFGAKRKSIRSLEDEITRVSIHNIMPANAAAWYLAKRKYYLRNPPEYQLLPFLLRNHPEKFRIKGANVDFLETYEKEVAARKLKDLNRLGLVAYFTHKVEEYGVYLFDPLYYEKTEPFYAGLKLEAGTRGSKVHRSELMPALFQSMPNMHLEKVNPYLMALSTGGEAVEVRTNCVAVVVKMMDKSHGILQFGTDDGTAKAVFTTKALYQDGFQFKTGDVMSLPAVEFDGYRLPKRVNGAPLEYSWAAVLVWCGKKPSPKYNATKADLMVEAAFGATKTSGMASTFDELLISKGGLMEGTKGGKHAKFNPIAAAEAAIMPGVMSVGEVVTLRANGALVTLSNDEKSEKVFIPGYRSKKGKKNLITTVSSQILAIGDIIGYYCDPSQKAPNGTVAVGTNIIVLKKMEERHLAETDRKGGARKARTTSQTESEGRTSSGEDNGKKTSTTRRERKPRTKSVTSEGEDGDKVPKSQKPKWYLNYLLADPVPSDVDNESLHSEIDPPYFGAAFHDADYDFDEYSDGEIEEAELEDVKKEGKEEIDVDELMKLVAEDEERRKEEARLAKEQAREEAKAAKEKAREELKAKKEAEYEERKAKREAAKAEKEAARAEEKAEKEAARAEEKAEKEEKTSEENKGEKKPKKAEVQEQADAAPAEGADAKKSESEA